MKLSITKNRKGWWLVSGSLVVLSIIVILISLFTLGAPVRVGLDFVGGTRLELARDCSGGADCSSPITTSSIRDVLVDQGLDQNSSIQILGQDQQAVSIRTQDLNVDERTQLESALASKLGPFDGNRTQIDTVGPVIGRRLLASGLLSLVVAFGGIVLYLTIRFKVDYAVLALVALGHDVLITVGVFATLGLVLGLEVDTLFLVALLTITGFSVNDTVVIYDRIREMGKLHADYSVGEIVDSAVNQTLGRSVNTTVTTTLPLFAILLLGGATLREFSFALIIGFILGAYSSIFVATSLLGWWRESRGLAFAVATEALAEPEDPKLSV